MVKNFNLGEQGIGEQILFTSVFKDIINNFEKYYYLLMIGFVKFLEKTSKHRSLPYVRVSR